MSKAQMEIMGLAIIIILLSLGVLFAVKYIYLSPEKEIKQEFIQKNIAQTMLNAILDSDIECNNNYISIRNLLIDCNKYYTGDLSNSGSITCNGEFSCEFVKKKISDILGRTLEVWKNDYYFEAGVINIKENCEGGKKTGMQILPNLGIVLDICG